MPQTSYLQTPAIARAGMIADSGRMSHIVGRAAEGAVRVGLLAARGTSKASQVKAMETLVSDVDAILATGGSTNGVQTLDTELDGAVGRNRIVPAQQIGLVLSSHADWDATTAVITGEDTQGHVIQESVAIPNGGNATVKTVRAFARVTSVSIPAQTGSGGTMTIGTFPDAPEISLEDYAGIALDNVAREPFDANNTYADNDSVNVLERGDVYVVVEDTVVPGGQVYVRTTTASTNVPGQFAGAGSANHARLVGASYRTGASASGFAVVRLP